MATTTPSLTTPFLKVRYPASGRRFLLQWWTQHERGHLIVAKSKTALDASVRALADKFPWATITNACVVDLVSPPARLHRAAALHRKKRNIKFFVGVASTYVREMHPLPYPFARCETYEPKEPVKDGAPQDDWYTERHYDCRHCDGRVRLLLPPEEFYDRYWERFTAVLKVPAILDPVGVYSTAPEPDPKKPIWMASSASMGDHGQGLTLGKLEIPSRFKPDGWFDETVFEHALFYFQKVEDIDPAPYRELLLAANDARDAGRELAETQREREQLAEKEARFRQLRIVFSATHTTETVCAGEG